MDNAAIDIQPQEDRWVFKLKQRESRILLFLFFVLLVLFVFLVFLPEATWKSLQANPPQRTLNPKPKKA